MNRKKLSRIILGIGMLVGIQTTAWAKPVETTFFLNGKERDDVEVVVKNDVTYVPLRLVGEELDAQVEYDAMSKKVTIVKDKEKLEVPIGSNQGVLNGEEVELIGPMFMHTNEWGESLTYIPLRNIFEILGGIVDYNEDDRFINAYNPNHTAYKALEGLKSDDLTAYRFAQLALPRVNGEDVYPGGGYGESYIFPLNTKSNYFLLIGDPSFDMPIQTIAYYEIENGVAYCKWFKEVRGDEEGRPHTQETVFDRYLGEGNVTQEVGTLPELEESIFIVFHTSSMRDPSPEDDMSVYYEYVDIREKVGLLGVEDMYGVLENIALQYPIFSPYGDRHILSKVDEVSLAAMLEEYK